MTDPGRPSRWTHWRTLWDLAAVAFAVWFVFGPAGSIVVDGLQSVHAALDATVPAVPPLSVATTYDLIGPVAMAGFVGAIGGFLLGFVFLHREQNRRLAVDPDEEPRPGEEE